MRATFFARLRATGLLGATLAQTEVDGLTGLLDAWERLGWPGDLRHVAYTLATAWHECRLNLSIREDGLGRGHPYGVPVDGRVYYGRGASQLTWLDNYRRFGRRLGLDLVGDPDLALVPETSAAILIVGARDGLFRPAIPSRATSTAAPTIRRARGPSSTATARGTARGSRAITPSSSPASGRRAPPRRRRPPRPRHRPPGGRACARPSAATCRRG